MSVLRQDHCRFDAVRQEKSSEIEEFGIADELLDFWLFKMGLVEFLGST